MNTKSFFMVAIGAFVLASCNLNQVDQTGLLTASVRDALNSPATLSIADEIESVEYIPLEMTNDDASLIDGVVDFAITSKYICIGGQGSPYRTVRSSRTLFAYIPSPRPRSR